MVTHCQVCVASITRERAIVHLPIPWRQRRRESRKVKTHVIPIQRGRVTKKTEPELRRSLIERRSRGVRCRVRKRGIHAELRKPTGTEKHARAQAERLNAARLVATAHIVSS